MLRGHALKRFEWTREARTLLLLVLLLALGTWREPRLLEPSSISSILLWIPLLAVVALGEMTVIVTRGIDVSVGSALGLTGIIVGVAFKAAPELGLELAAGLSVLAGAALGLVNGALVVGARVPPIVATLGTLTAFRGLAFIVSKGEQVDSNDIPDALSAWSVEGPLRLGGVTLPWLLVIALLLLLAGHLVLSRTRYGRWVYAVGGNEEAARLSGIPVRRVLLSVYVLAGALAGLAGLLYASRFNFVNPATAGQGFELTVIAAAVIGGTNIMGGSGSVPGVFLGCALLAVVNVALAVMGIAATWQLAVYGAIILAAMLLEEAAKGKER